MCFLEMEKMNKIMKMYTITMLVAFASLATVAQANNSTFDDLTLPANSYWNGFDGSGGFSSGAAHYNNTATPAWNYWEGFAYSNLTDTATGGLTGQYSAIAGGGAGGTANYGLGFVGWSIVPTISFNHETVAKSMFVTNNNYTYYSMLNGDAYSKKFGGADGSQADWFRLTITGKNAAGNTTGSIDFYLADFRFADNNQDYIVNDWCEIDLTSLGSVQSLEFGLSSSDNGAFGMNTPAYFALDSVSVVPAPGAALLAGVGVSLFGYLRRRKTI